jgi:hypothetical protein
MRAQRHLVDAFALAEQTSQEANGTRVAHEVLGV